MSRIKTFNTFLLLVTLFFVSFDALAEETVEEKKKYVGNIDLGATFARGNSREQSLQANSNLTYDFNETYQNISRLRAENKKLNNLRTKEEYFVNNQTRQNISKFNFRLVELEFISDRFGGYNYRTSETVGLGRKIIDSEKTQLSIQVSAGARQSKLTNGEKTNSFIARTGLNFSTKINEFVIFEENLDISFDRIATIIRSDANLRILMTKKLYLKLGLLLNHVSDVPQGRKNTDSTTALKIGYQF